MTLTLQRGSAHGRNHALRFARTFTLIALVLSAACSEDGSGDADLPDEVSVVIGEKGGQLKAKGVSLVIPAGALDKDVTITASSTDKEAPADAKAISKVYEFGPKGTKFAKEITVSFDTDKDEPEAKVYFTKEGSDKEFEMLTTETKAKVASAKVKHFSLGFVGIAADGNGGLDAGGDGDAVDAGTGSRADGGSGPDASQMVDAGNQVRLITVQSKDLYGLNADQTWGAYQDGDGPWELMPPPVTPGNYQFTVKEARFGVAFVCAAEGSQSVGTMIMAPSTSTSHTIEASANCVTKSPGGYDISGLVTPPDPGGTSKLFRYAHPYGGGGIGLVGVGPKYAYTVPSLPADISVDPIVVITDDYALPNKVLILRNQRASANVMMDLDLASQGSTVSPATFSVANGSDLTNIDITLTTNNSSMSGMRLYGTNDFATGTNPRTLSYVALTTPSFVASDHYRFYAWEDAGEQYRELELMTQTSGNHSADLPPPFPVDFSRAGGAYVRPTVSFQAVANASEYTLSWQHYESGETPHEFVTHVESGWLDGSTPTMEFTFPDLSGVTGYDAVWFAPGNSSYLQTRFGAVTSGAALGGTLRTLSESSSNLMIPL